MSQIGTRNGMTHLREATAMSQLGTGKGINQLWREDL